MEVFQFEKSMMDRLEEAQNVLSCNKVIPASRVAEEWSYNVELLIEPAGNDFLCSVGAFLFVVSVHFARQLFCCFGYLNVPVKQHKSVVETIVNLSLFPLIEILQAGRQYGKYLVLFAKN